MSEHEFAELAAGHALGALSAEDELAFEAALVLHPEWSRHVRAASDVVAELAETVEPEAPPPGIRAALLAQIAADSPVGAPATAESPRTGGEPVGPRMLRRWLALAASVVLIAAVVTGGVVIGQQLGRPAAVVALERIEGSPDAQSATVTLADGGEAVAHWSESVAQAVLVVDGLPAPGAGETFELWYVRDAGPTPAGTFTTDADGRATALLSGTQRPGDVIAVTVEPAGGSPSGQPTTDPILAIPT